MEGLELHPNKKSAVVDDRDITRTSMKVDTGEALLRLACVYKGGAKRCYPLKSRVTAIPGGENNVPNSCC